MCLVVTSHGKIIEAAKATVPATDYTMYFRGDTDNELVCQTICQVTMDALKSQCYDSEIQQLVVDTASSNDTATRILGQHDNAMTVPMQYYGHVVIGSLNSNHEITRCSDTLFELLVQ